MTRITAVLHKRHGWIEAPEGMWIEETEKSLWLCGDPGEGRYTYPFGTRWNATSIYAVSTTIAGKNMAKDASPTLER